MFTPALRNENDFDFAAIAGVSCCIVRRNLTRIQRWVRGALKDDPHHRSVGIIDKGRDKHWQNTLRESFWKAINPTRETSIGLPMGIDDPREHARNRRPIWHHVQQSFSDCCSSIKRKRFVAIHLKFSQKYVLMKTLKNFADLKTTIVDKSKTQAF